MESRKEKENQKENNQALNVEDLPAEETEQDHIKGGATGTWYLRNSNSPGAA